MSSTTYDVKVGGAPYTAGAGISIADKQISVDTATIQTKITPNPATTTATLTGLEVDGTAYNIAGGSGEPAEYLKDAATSGTSITITKKDDTEIIYDPIFTAHYDVTLLSEMITQWTAGKELYVANEVSHTRNSIPLYSVYFNSETGTPEAFLFRFMDEGNQYTYILDTAWHTETTNLQGELTAGSGITLSEHNEIAADFDNEDTEIAVANKKYVDDSVTGLATIDEVDDEIDTRVTASATGTSTTEVSYLTVGDTEYKLAGGGGSTITVSSSGVTDGTNTYNASDKQDASTAYNTSNIVYNSEEPSSPTTGMIWLYPAS